MACSISPVPRRSYHAVFSLATGKPLKNWQIIHEIGCAGVGAVMAYNLASELKHKKKQEQEGYLENNLPLAVALRYFQGYNKGFFAPVTVPYHYLTEQYSKYLAEKKSQEVAEVCMKEKCHKCHGPGEETK
jgi:hypothetical protein